jgi:hypothetical protein
MPRGLFKGVEGQFVASWLKPERNILVLRRSWLLFGNCLKITCLFSNAMDHVVHFSETDSAKAYYFIYNVCVSFIGNGFDSS